MRAASWVVAVAVFLSAVTARAQTDMAKVLIKKADRLHTQRAAGKAPEAVTAYEKVLAVDGNNVEARWKLARSYYWLGTHSKGKAAIGYYEKAIRYTQDAIKLNPSCVDCHFWLGVSYGMFGEANGVLQSLGLVPKIKEEMNTVIKLDPKYQFGSPQRVLGRLYYRLPALKGGDNQKALKLLREACALGPNVIMNHLFLVDVLLSEGQKDEARKELELVINMPEAQMPQNYIPESKEDQAAARKLYERKFGGK